MFSDDRQAQLMKLAAMKGPALSIFIALLIAQQPMNANELQIYTGYANQAVTKGIKALEILRAVIHRGAKGWELLPNWRQLPLPILYIGNHENHDWNHENHDSQLPPPHTRDLLTTFTTTTTKQTNQEAVVVTREAHHENHDLPPTPVDNLIKAWLERGGVGPNSPQMQQLMAKQLDVDYVKAHVLERLAQVQGGNNRFGAGLLITRLSAGDAPPAMRCEECLKIEHECNCDEVTCPDCGRPVPFIGYRCDCQIIKR